MPHQTHLRILSTTDLHAHVLPYDYYADRTTDNSGLTRTAQLILAAREDAQNSILVDNGDFLQGTPIGDYIAYERGLPEGEVHPIVNAMNMLEFDASTLGNHEFNYGLDFLRDALKGADFPFVSSNVTTTRAKSALDDKTLVQPYVILERKATDSSGAVHPIKIGIIGFTPPQIMTWDRKNLEGKVQTRDIVDTARAYIPKMKAEGADIIVALSHSGIGSAAHTPGMENASVPLAALDGIDAVVTGHSHLVFPSPTFAGYDAVDAQTGHIHGKPAVMAGLWGSHLGVIDLVLERVESSWRVTHSFAEARPIARHNADGSFTPLTGDCALITTATAQRHIETLAYIRRPVGKASSAMTSYFALVSDNSSIQCIADAQTWHVREQLKNTEHADLPLLCAVSPGKSGGRAGPDHYTDVPKGDIAIRHISDLYVFPNTLRAVRITGVQLKNWLERSAGQFLQLQTGQQDQPLIDPSFPSYNFDIICGVTYEIDVSQPARFTVTGTPSSPRASRICNLQYQGRDITPEMEFIVCTNSYRADGGGQFPGADGTTTVLESPDTIRDILIRYLTKHGTLSANAPNNWRFAPLEGTTALFETNVKAADHLPSLKQDNITLVQSSRPGLAQFRLSL